jgi:MYXO-CTERM domain-containing protein
MNKMKQRLVVSLLALSSSSWSSLARAKPEFPSEIKNKYVLHYDVPCAVCHIKGNTGSSTPITPFALSLRARGMTGDNQALSSALDKLKSDAVDSDGDGVTDVDELVAGTDPNSSANASIEDTQEPGYGCGGTAPTGRSAPGMAGVLALAWFVLRRRRGHS